MPELPEVETIATELDGQIRGLQIDRVRLTRKDIVHGDPRPLARVLTGRRIQSVQRRAKRVVIDLGAPVQLIIHLGMSGTLRLCDSGEAIEKHTHLRLALASKGRELRFRDPRRFGGIWCLAGNDKFKGRQLGPLGPEPLSLSTSDFRDLIARPRQIKALLLDQTAIAGMGNIYCDEALHAARIHPLKKSEELTNADAATLIRAIKSILRSAIRFGGSTRMDYRRSDGGRGSFQDRHRVYGREGMPCRTCGTPIIRIQAAGRSSSLCPNCQQA